MCVVEILGHVWPIPLALLGLGEERSRPLWPWVLGSNPIVLKREEEVWVGESGFESTEVTPELMLFGDEKTLRLDLSAFAWGTSPSDGAQEGRSGEGRGERYYHPPDWKVAARVPGGLKIPQEQTAEACGRLCGLSTSSKGHYQHPGQWCQPVVLGRERRHSRPPPHPPQAAPPFCLQELP